MYRKNLLLIIFIFLSNDCFGKKIKGFDPDTGCVLLPDDWDIKKDFVDADDCKQCHSACVADVTHCVVECCKCQKPPEGL